MFGSKYLDALKSALGNYNRRKEQPLPKDPQQALEARVRRLELFLEEVSSQTK